MPDDDKGSCPEETRNPGRGIYDWTLRIRRGPGHDRLNRRYGSAIWVLRCRVVLRVLPPLRTRAFLSITTP